jgi:hypothetical protein
MRSQHRESTTAGAFSCPEAGRSQRLDWLLGSTNTTVESAAP